MYKHNFHGEKYYFLYKCILMHITNLFTYFFPEFFIFISLLISWVLLLVGFFFHLEFMDALCSDVFNGQGYLSSLGMMDKAHGEIL